MKTRPITILLSFIFFSGSLYAQTGELMSCVFAGDLDCAKKVLDEGSNVNEWDEQSGTTPLMMACS